MLHYRLAFLIIILGSTAVATAHKHACVHTHANGGNSVVTCATNGATCTQAGNTGVCKSIQGRTRVWCRCTADGGGDDPEACNGSSTQYFSAQGEGLPTPNTPIIYLAEGNEMNFVSISMGGDIEGPELDAKSDAIQGTFDLFFGSFADPENVPVTVENVSLSLIEIAGEGLNWIELPDGEFQYLVYNSVAKTIDSVDGNGIQLWLSNDLGSTLPVTVNLSGQFTPSGDLEGFAQAAVGIQILLDAFESGDTGGWGPLKRLLGID